MRTLVTLPARGRGEIVHVATLARLTRHSWKKKKTKNKVAKDSTSWSSLDKIRTASGLVAPRIPLVRLSPRAWDAAFFKNRIACVDKRRPNEFHRSQKRRPCFLCPPLFPFVLCYLLLFLFNVLTGSVLKVNIWRWDQMTAVLISMSSVTAAPSHVLVTARESPPSSLRWTSLLMASSSK